MIPMAVSVDSLFSLLDGLPLSGWGVSDVWEDTSPRFRNAVCLLQAYHYPLENYSPFDFHEFLLNRVKPALDANVRAVADFLEKKDVSFHIVTNQRKNSLLLTGEYSQKRAAARAGLGWIGKNTLLINPQFGPRIRLATILTDCDLPTSPAAKLPGCGYCAICVDCCPSMSLKNKNWESGGSREDMIDIDRCRETNDAIAGCICGVCLLACPIGKENSLSENVVR